MMDREDTEVGHWEFIKSVTTKVLFIGYPIAITSSMYYDIGMYEAMAYTGIIAIGTPIWVIFIAYVIHGLLLVSVVMYSHYKGIRNQQ